MALNDKAVVTAAQGFVFTNVVGAAPPTPEELDALDPELFGAKVVTLKVTGTPTSLKLAVGAGTSDLIPLTASAAVIQSALEGLATVGSGNVSVSGIGLGDVSGVDVAFIGALQGKSITITATDYVAGTTPALVTTTKVALNGWINTGHTSREDMPEFGFEGGEAEVKGTWQNAALREVVSEQAADYVTVVLQQFDENSFELYYGANASSTPGVFGVAGGVAAPNERAFLTIIRDGTTNVGFYATKASVRRDDAVQLPVDEFAGFPVRFTFLKHGAARLFDWISKDLFS